MNLQYLSCLLLYVVYVRCIAASHFSADTAAAAADGRHLLQAMNTTYTNPRYQKPYNVCIIHWLPLVRQLDTAEAQV
jgi:hypothetical protein